MPSDTSLSIFPGHYSDGRTAASIPADVILGAQGVQITDANGGKHSWPYEALRSGVGLNAKSSEVLLRPAQQASTALFVDDPTFVVKLLDHAPHLGARRERFGNVVRLLPIPVLMFGAYAAIYAFDLHPAQSVAKLLPEQSRAILGQQVITQMTRGKRICETTGSRAAMDRLVDRLSKAGFSQRPNVRIVDWELVNAFAAPGGQVIVTRALIQKAASPDEVAGVLAHEIGHTIELHPEAGLVRGIGLMAAAQMIFTGSPGTLGNAGVFVAQMDYTRTSEREADEQAIRLLKGSGIALKGITDFFERMRGQEAAGKSGTDAKPAEDKKRVQPSVVFDIFRSHPATGERIARMKQEPAYPATPALEAADWQALRTACGPTAPAGTAPAPPAAPAR
jgi:beta-barrel assembly-enhancing protease